jgi:mycoredoxin
MAEATAIDFYWRPGCGFCMALERQFNKHGIKISKHNIWEDASNAEHVRRVTGGAETVPTLTIGDRSMVNPRIGDVVELLQDTAPHLLPEGYKAPEGNAASRLVSRIRN